MFEKFLMYKLTPLQTSPLHPSLTLPYKGGKRSSFYDWRGFENPIPF
jgi:hypothetical protein